MNIRVIVAYPYVTPGGRHFKPDSIVSVDLEEGQRLIMAGLARPADKPAARSTPRVEPTHTEKKD